MGWISVCFRYLRLTPFLHVKNFMTIDGLSWVEHRETRDIHTIVPCKMVLTSLYDNEYEDESAASDNEPEDKQPEYEDASDTPSMVGGEWTWLAPPEP